MSFASSSTSFWRWKTASPAQRAAFRSGFTDFIPTVPGTITWGLVTGVAMVQSGLSLAQAAGMSLTVFAGSAQLSSLPLIAGAAPIWVVILTALVVNLRFVIYAAALRSHFASFSRGQRIVLGYLTGDIGFVLFMNKVHREGRFEHPDWYFIGGASCNMMCWQAGSFAGIFAASFIPLAWGLDFAGPLALMALLIPLCATRPVIAGALVASIVAVLAHGLPYRLGLVCAVVAGITSAIWVERS